MKVRGGGGERHRAYLRRPKCCMPVFDVAPFPELLLLLLLGMTLRVHHYSSEREAFAHASLLTARLMRVGGGNCGGSYHARTSIMHSWLSHMHSRDRFSFCGVNGPFVGWDQTRVSLCGSQRVHVSTSHIYRRGRAQSCLS